MWYSTLVACTSKRCDITSLKKKENFGDGEKDLRTEVERTYHWEGRPKGLNTLEKNIFGPPKGAPAERIWFVPNPPVHPREASVMKTLSPKVGETKQRGRFTPERAGVGP